MTTPMKAKLRPPYDNCMGNLLWRKAELAGKEALLDKSIAKIAELGYWASSFPEGDGVAFEDKGGGRTAEQMHADFQACFPWLTIKIGTQGSSNLDLAELEAEAEIATKLACTVIVPVLKLHFESSWSLGPFRLVCASEFDPEPQERLGDWEGSKRRWRMK